MIKSLEILNDKSWQLEDYKDCVIIVEEFEQIKQDLEVLEILKPYLYINLKSNNNVEIISMKDILKIRQVGNEKVDKIKQWLLSNKVGDNHD